MLIQEKVCEKGEKQEIIKKKFIISKARKRFLMPKFRLQNYVIVLDWVKSSFFESFSIIQSLNKFKLKIKKKNCQKF